MGLCVGLRDTSEHARVPIPMIPAGGITAPQFIHWREDAASNRTRVLVAASRSRQIRAVPPRDPGPFVDHPDAEEPSTVDRQADVRGRMIDILV